MPTPLIIVSAIVQLILSFGIFIFILLLFKSAFLPPQIPNDDWSALTIAYFLSSIPHIVVGTALLIYDKEIQMFVEKRYGSEALNEVNNADNVKRVAHIIDNPFNEYANERIDESIKNIASIYQDEDGFVESMQDLMETKIDLEQSIAPNVYDEKHKENVCEHCGQEIKK